MRARQRDYQGSSSELDQDDTFPAEWAGVPAYEGDPPYATRLTSRVLTAFVVHAGKRSLPLPSTAS